MTRLSGSEIISLNRPIKSLGLDFAPTLSTPGNSLKLEKSNYKYTKCIILLALPDSFCEIRLMMSCHHLESERKNYQLRYPLVVVTFG